jgi:hypothetical protein
MAFFRFEMKIKISIKGIIFRVSLNFIFPRNSILQFKRIPIYVRI